MSDIGRVAQRKETEEGPIMAGMVVVALPEPHVVEQVSEARFAQHEVLALLRDFPKPQGGFGGEPGRVELIREFKTESVKMRNGGLSFV